MLASEVLSVSMAENMYKYLASNVKYIYVYTRTHTKACGFLTAFMPLLDYS